VEIINLLFMGKNLLKQVVGIDVAQKKIDVCLGRMDEHASTEVYAYRGFSNSEKGFMALILWVKKHTGSEPAIRFVMEATGVYHEQLAYFLSANGFWVSIIMPNKISNFFKTRVVKTITDKSMAETIAMYGLEKTIENWTQPRKVYRDLRQLTRERNQLVEERTVVKNQLHAEQVRAYPNERTIDRVMVRLKMLNGQIKEIIDEISQINKEDKEIGAATKLMTTIPGIGLLTAVTILGETDGFALITNRRQLTSYAGLDVIAKESGTSVRAKPRISKKGNKHLRKAMYLPALSAIRHLGRYKDTYVRIVSKTGIKMKAAVAIQRKMLELAYTIYITGKPYDIDYLEKQAAKKQEMKEA
jgi:transposase